MNAEEDGLGCLAHLEPSLFSPRVLRLLERNLASGVVACEYLLIKESPKQRGANLFISKRKPGIPAATLTGSAHCERTLGRRAEGREGWGGAVVVILGKPDSPDQVHSPFPVLFILTRPGHAFFIWIRFRYRRVDALTHLTQWLRRTTEHSWTGIHPPTPPTLPECLLCPGTGL